VAVMSFSTAANVTGQMLWYPVLALFFRELGASDFQASLAYGLIAAANAFLQLPGGVLADRFGRKRLIVWPTFVAAAAFVAAALSRSWVPLALALFAQAACSAIQAPSFVALVAESVPADRRGEAFAYLELWASAGIGLGPILGALLLPYLPMAALFGLTAAVFVASAIARQLWLRESLSRPFGNGGDAATPRLVGDPTQPRSVGDPATSRPVANQATPRPVAGFRLSALFRGRLAWLTVTAIAISVAINLTLYGPFLPLLAYDVLGFTGAQIDILYASGPLFAAVLGVAMGRLLARKGGRLGVSLGLLLTGVSLVAFLAAPSFWVALAVIAVTGAAVQFTFIGYDDLRAEATDEETRGRVVGALGSLSGAAGAIAVPLVGKLAGGPGPGLAIYIGAAFCVLGAVAAQRVGRAEPPG